MPSAIKPLKVTDEGRLQAAKELVSGKRKETGWKAAYELYGIRFGRGSVKTAIIAIESAPTSGDFAPLIKKGRIAQALESFDMIVEFRGAWGSDDKAKVVVYEETPLMGQKEVTPIAWRTA